MPRQRSRTRGLHGLSVRRVRTLHDVEALQALLREYRDWLVEHREVTHFADSILARGVRGLEAEIRLLPRTVRRRRSRYFIARWSGRVAGCVALRPLGRNGGELTRLFVRPPARRRRIGRALTERVLRSARSAGYVRVVLDTLPTMAPAIRLYGELGFRPTRPYWNNPVPGALFFERRFLRAGGPVRG